MQRGRGFRGRVAKGDKSGLGVVVQKRIPVLVQAPWDGPAIAFQSLVTMIMAAAIQPTIGMISDHTISRWGRRKPYIAIGATLDVLFLIGIGLSNTYLTLVAFLVALKPAKHAVPEPELTPEAQKMVAQ